LKPYALIVDDNALNVDVLVTLLELEGFECSAVATPHAFLTLLDTLNHVDIVFLDLELPSVDGFSLLEDLKGDIRFQRVPIVAYTVHTSEIDEVRRAGFHSFLGKPLDAQKFSGQIRRILDNIPVWE
jgi:CheY-like chemotaxis protein